MSRLEANYSDIISSVYYTRNSNLPESTWERAKVRIRKTYCIGYDTRASYVILPPLRLIDQNATRSRNRSPKHTEPPLPTTASLTFLVAATRLPIQLRRRSLASNPILLDAALKSRCQRLCVAAVLYAFLLTLRASFRAEIQVSRLQSRGSFACLSLLKIAPEDEEFLAEHFEGFGVGAEAVCRSEVSDGWR